MGIEAAAFCRHWVDAWNRHDVDAVLEHFHDDVVFTSPVAAAMFPHTEGKVHGKIDLRRYWTAAVQRRTDLHFVLEDVYQGVDILVINYRNQTGGLVNEVLRFDNDLVVEGHGTYLIGDRMRLAD